jgi:hypothetical protein
MASNTNAPMMKVALSKGDSVGIFRLELENISDMHLLITNWGMPTSEGKIESDAFDVKKCSGGELFYKGMVISRVGIEADDLFHLRPGEKVARPVNLVNCYGLGNVDCYTVQYNTCFQYRAFKTREQVSDFLQKFKNAPRAEKISLVECLKSDVVKIERP